MKQNDISILAIVVVISAIFSYLIVGVIFPSEAGQSTMVPKVQAITSDFPTTTQISPFFNTNSIDPVQLIHIGQDTNTSPFSGGSAS